MGSRLRPKLLPELLLLLLAVGQPAAVQDSRRQERRPSARNKGRPRATLRSIVCGRGVRAIASPSTVRLSGGGRGRRGEGETQGEGIDNHGKM
jgi:hypothetical protein